MSSKTKNTRRIPQDAISQARMPKPTRDGTMFATTLLFQPINKCGILHDLVELSPSWRDLLPEPAGLHAMGVYWNPRCVKNNNEIWMVACSKDVLNCEQTYDCFL
jgi:hypothetical protein